MPKKKQTTELKPKCKKIVFRVMKGRQWRDFDIQSEAREHLVKCLEGNFITFCSLEQVEVEGC